MKKTKKIPTDEGSHPGVSEPPHNGNGIGSEPPSPAKIVTEVEQVLDPQRLEHDLNVLLESCEKNIKSFDRSLITRAFHLCVDAHKRTIRASGEPYYTHPFAVALILARELVLDDVSIAAALLHDVVEDTEFTLEDIRAEFGPTVAEIVDGVTKISGVFNSHVVTQAASYRKLLLSMVNDVRVILVKFADRLHNLRTLEFLPPHKQQRMARETLDIYAPFAHRFGLGNVKWELEDLSFKYLNPEAYNRLKTALNTKRKSREEYIERTIGPLRERLEAEGMHFDIYGRAKHLYSIYNKMRVQNKSLDEIHDLVAIRIILDTENPNECFTVYGIVSEIYTPVPEQFKNYISVPKKNGYQSIHTTIIGPDGRQVEVQIRTRKMHEVAERGIAAHFVYKEATLNPTVVNEDKQLEEWANWIRDIFERATDESASQEVLESFRLNLFQDEIYVFTPKGDLRILPKGATPIDFAYDIHSEVGYHCIGAKVNGRIVPLDTQLKSGDQVEILSSKNQTPSADWEKIAVTHKARSGIRRWLNDQRRKHVQQGRELWDKRAKKEKVHINDDELERLSHTLKYESRGDFFSDIGSGKLSPDDAMGMILERLKQPSGPRDDVTSLNGQLLYDRFVREARTTAEGVMIDGSVSGVKYNYAKCCNPIPGDQVIGVVKTGRGVTIHRSTCRNALTMMQEPESRNRTLDVSWGSGAGHDFMAAIRVSGEDRPGMLNDLTHAILSYQNTNMRSVNIESQDSMFEGVITVMVKNIEHLSRLIDRLRKVRNVRDVERFEQLSAE